MQPSAYEAQRSRRQIEAYIRKIRNPHKRDYALAYAEYCYQGQTGDEPPRVESLSYMGAQAVRMNTLDIIRKDNSNENIRCSSPPTELGT